MWRIRTIPLIVETPCTSVLWAILLPKMRGIGVLSEFCTNCCSFGIEVERMANNLYVFSTSKPITDFRRYKDGFCWQQRRLSFATKTIFVHGKNGLRSVPLQRLANQWVRRALFLATIHNALRITTLKIFDILEKIERMRNEKVHNGVGSRVHFLLLMGRRERYLSRKERLPVFFRLTHWEPAPLAFVPMWFDFSSVINL